MAGDGEARSETAMVRVPLGTHGLNGDLGIPPIPQGLIVFAHGSGGSRQSERNLIVARYLREEGLATLLIDLLTPEESAVDRDTAEFRDDISLLGERMTEVVDWVRSRGGTASLPLGLYGVGIGAAAALIAAAERPADVRAVVSRGGRLDLAEEALSDVQAPTLLIVGGEDEEGIALSEDGAERFRAPVRIALVPGASHLFEEPGALEEVAELAAMWFVGVFGGGHDLPLGDRAEARH